MKHLDEQLFCFKERLCHEVGLTPTESHKVATLVATDIRFLPIDVKTKIRDASLVPISARLDELTAFQTWSDFSTSAKQRPDIIRAAIIVQNYICFVYLKDACFEVLKKYCPKKSVAARTASFLTCRTIRDFRNAFSHANWCYNATFSGLKCWVLKDARNPSGPMRYFEASQSDIDFWQALSRCVAYSTYEQLRS